MKDCNGFKIIGVDHGFGNMKTTDSKSSVWITALAT